MEFLIANASTIVISVLLIVLVTGVVCKMRRDRKNGRSSCGCGCSGCPSEGMCHHK